MSVDASGASTAELERLRAEVRMLRLEHEAGAGPGVVREAIRLTGERDEAREQLRTARNSIHEARAALAEYGRDWTVPLGEQVAAAMSTLQAITDAVEGAANEMETHLKTETDLLLRLREALALRAGVARG